MNKLVLLITLMSSFSPLVAESPRLDESPMLDEDRGNGGDPCERKFNEIGDDIKNWVSRGGGEQLSLGSYPSSQKYKSMMLEAIRKSSVSCSDETIVVRGVEKTCKNISVATGSEITCNFSRFMNSSTEEQYRLVHHEYAGIAGFEVNLGKASDYRLSNQISGFLEETTVKRLAVNSDYEIDAEFVTIFADTFTMGSLTSKKESEKPRSVTITKDFEMMTTEVSQKLFVEIMGKNPSKAKEKKHCFDTYTKVKTKNGVISMCPYRPVEFVTFDEIKEFISKVNEMSPSTYRLPTEAEWEMAAKAGSETEYFFGDDPMLLIHYAVVGGDKRSNRIGPSQIGSKRNFANRPNPYGLYDMYGNVWEVVQDTFTLNPKGTVDPVELGGELQVIKGGAWFLPIIGKFNWVGEFTSANRTKWSKLALGDPENKERGREIGFRLVREIR